MEILGLKGSITKMKESLNRFFFQHLSVYPINNAVIVSGDQRSNLAIAIHVSSLPETPLPSRLPHNTEWDCRC